MKWITPTAINATIGTRARSVLTTYTQRGGGDWGVTVAPSPGPVMVPSHGEHHIRALI